jgi:hypothetical protein
MNKLLAVCIIGVFLFFPYPRTRLGAALAPTKVVIEREGGLIVARDQGFFRKHGALLRDVLVRCHPLAGRSSRHRRFL